YGDDLATALRAARRGGDAYAARWRTEAQRLRAVTKEFPRPTPGGPAPGTAGADASPDPAAEPPQPEDVRLRAAANELAQPPARGAVPRAGGIDASPGTANSDAAGVPPRLGPVGPAGTSPGLAPPRAGRRAGDGVDRLVGLVAAL